MKPIKIEFTAFGPYAQTETVDFSKMTNSNMFIITGPTGSGKTTIFDAMSFALYGSASGSDRSNDMFRSDFAKDTVETEVTFEFISNNIVYKITRKPAQYRPKLRGEGMRKIDASVKLEFKDQVYTSMIEVTSKIEEIIGLTKEQFKQIVLLPQGEFKKLLVSDSRSKEEIFRKIFNTSHIKRIQENLRVESSQLKRQIEDSELKINTFLSQYSNVTNSKQLTYAQTNAKLNYEQLVAHKLEIDSELELVETKLDKEKTYQQNVIELNQVKTELANYEQNKSKYQLYSSFIDNVPVLINYQNDINSLEKSKLNLSQYQTNNQELEKQLEASTHKLNETELQLEASKVQYDELDSKRANVNQLERKLELIVEQLELKQLINQYQTKLDNQLTSKDSLIVVNEQLKQKASQITANIEQYDINVNQINKLEQNIEVVSKKLQVTQEINSLNNKVTDNMEQGRLLTEQLELETNALSNLRISYFSAQAGNLAKQLEDDTPCPVCGSTNHPQPATTVDSDTTIEVINEQETIVGQINHKLSKISSLIEVDKALSNKLTSEYQIDDCDYNQELQKLNETKSQLVAVNNNLDIDIEAINQQLTTNNNQIQNITTEIENTKYMIEQSTKKITLDEEQLSAKQRLETEFKTQLELIASISTNYQLIADNYQRLKSTNDKLQSNITFNNELVIKVQLEIDELTNLITNFESNFEQQQLQDYVQMLPNQALIQKEYNDYLTNKALLENQLRELMKATTSYATIDTASLQSKLTVLYNEQKIYQQLTTDYHAYLSRLNTDIKAIADIESSIKSTYQKYQVVADISDVANGKTISKISFERYMLSIYFKQIITRANVYFKTMTNNRFELEYKSPAKGRSAQGLDLNIIDNYTTKVRDVKSLSGGESFKAALSMALGLSDIVQMNSGGIQIDTIFIDEGFGSLDIDSLNTAIDTLINIESEGRMVGIISHVEELKNQVSNKIIITPSTSGSSLKTNFN